MTTEEQDAVVGRLKRELKQARIDVAVSRLMLRYIATAMEKLAHDIKATISNPQWTDGVSIPEDLRGYLTTALKAKVDEYHTLSGRERRLGDSAFDLEGVR